MPVFQEPPTTPEALEAAKPLEIPPEEVLTFDEDEWYRRAYRGDHAPQLTVRAVLMGTVLGFFLSFTNVYIGLKTGWFLGVALTACILSFAVWGGLRKVGLEDRHDDPREQLHAVDGLERRLRDGNTVASAIPAMLLLSVTPENPAARTSPGTCSGSVFFLALGARWPSR